MEFNSIRCVWDHWRVSFKTLSNCSPLTQASRSTLALSVAVIIHPSQLARVILAAILVPALFVLCILPLERTRRASLRLALSSTGAFGLVLSIALFSHIAAWADVWDRLWVSDGEEWGTGKEKALSAAWSLLLACGMGSDWLLKRQFGSNPDQVSPICRDLYCNVNN